MLPSKEEGQLGKPLISDAQMLAIYRTMQQLRETQTHVCASARRAPAAASPMPLALLAASLLQLRTEDVLVTEGEQPLAQKVFSLARESSFHPEVLPFTVATSDRTGIAALATGYALAQSHYSHPGDSAPVTLALLQADTPVQEAMRLAGEHLLPLILLVRAEPNKPRLPMAAPPNVEVVQVDAEDAVAICRVMQESMLRARNRWGSVVLRAVTLPDTPDPILVFEAHLRRRGLLH